MHPTQKNNANASHQATVTNSNGAVFLWNHHLAASTTIFRDAERLTNFKFACEEEGSSPAPFSTLMSSNNIVSISELEEADEPEELECSDLKPKALVYNIIQNKMNLHEKRGPKFNCRECRLPMHTQLSMITHMKMHLKPFCEACFAVFETKDAVHTHIEATHPEVVIRDRSPSSDPRDFYSLQTVAPPNTPNPMSDDEMAAIEGLVNPIVKFPISVFQKLTGHEDADGDASAEDEQRLVIDDRSKPGPSRGRTKKKPCLKRQLKKTSKNKVKDVAVADNVMKKITSRFGRSISLKMPQY